MGHFDYNGAKIIHTSDITGYIENPNGAFQCTSKSDCPVDWIRYKPSFGESISDIIKCPKCSNWMMNEGLSVEWGRSLDKIRTSPSGTPEGYQIALEGLAIFKRFYTATLLVENAKQWTAPVIPALDVIIDIAPKIFDEKTICFILEYVSNTKLKFYTSNLIIKKTSDMVALKNFYDSLPMNTPIKQTELVKLLKEHLPHITDPTWVFYIWSNFKLVKRTKEKNRIYLERLQK